MPGVAPVCGPCSLDNKCVKLRRHGKTIGLHYTNIATPHDLLRERPLYVDRLEVTEIGYQPLSTFPLKQQDVETPLRVNITDPRHAPRTHQTWTCGPIERSHAAKPKCTTTRPRDLATLVRQRRRWKPERMARGRAKPEGRRSITRWTALRETEQASLSDSDIFHEVRQHVHWHVSAGPFQDQTVFYRAPAVKDGR